jgi:hypothetical protein
MRLVLASMICGLMSSSAWASGGMSCSNEGGDATVEINAGITRGMGGPVFSLTGLAEVSSTEVAEDLRKTSFEREHMAQYWLDGEEFRMLLYRERPAEKEHGYVELELRAKGIPDEEGFYSGTYVLKTWDGTGSGEPKEKKFEGKIACSGE